MKNDLPPTCDFQISLTINCESTWLSPIEHLCEHVLNLVNWSNQTDGFIYVLCMVYYSVAVLYSVALQYVP